MSIWIVSPSSSFHEIANAEAEREKHWEIYRMYERQVPWRRSLCRTFFRRVSSEQFWEELKVIFLWDLSKTHLTTRGRSGRLVIDGCVEDEGRRGW